MSEQSASYALSFRTKSRRRKAFAIYQPFDLLKENLHMKTVKTLFAAITLAALTFGTTGTLASANAPKGKASKMTCCTSGAACCYVGSACCTADCNSK